MLRFPLNINDDVTTVYDQTKTFLAGRVFQGMLGLNKYLSVPKNVWVDTLQDAALAPASATHLTDNDRLFIMTAETAGVAAILAYNFNKNTGVKSYIGRINVSLPDVAATVHTFRFERVIDTGTTGWKFLIGSAASTVTLNGGLFLVNGINLSDFTLGGTSIPFATGNNQKAVYFKQTPTEQGALHSVNQTIVGRIFDQATNLIGYFNGSAASFNFLAFDFSATQTWSSAPVIGTAATDFIDYIGHPFANNDPIVFLNSTMGGVVSGTVYFVRNPVANGFNISATSGGANLNITTDGVGDCGRAFGTSSSGFLYKTGTMSGANALAGTIINDSTRVITPNHGQYAGQKCVFMATTTTFYLFLLSDLSSGITSLPSLISVNVLGVPSQDIAFTPIASTWSESIDRIVTQISLSRFYTKQFVSNSVENRFGNQVIRAYESQNPDVVEFGATAISTFDTDNGWASIVGTTTGQRGVIMYNISSDIDYDQSYFTTKVFTLTNTNIKDICGLFEARGFSSIKLFYRTSGFGVPTGGWTEVAPNKIINLGVGTDIQLKCGFKTALFSTNAPLLYDLGFTLESNDSSSINWAFDDEQSISTNPAYSAFRQIRAYSGGPKTLEFTAIDDSGAIKAQARTDTDFAEFDKSSNTGTSWSAMTGANDYANVPLTTEIRFKWSSPPGVRVRVFVREVD